MLVSIEANIWYVLARHNGKKILAKPLFIVLYV